MALWIGGQISSGDGLFYSSKEILEQKGAKIHMETEVYKIDFEKKLVYAKGVQDGKEYRESYDKLILSRSEEHTSELQSRQYLVCRLLLEKKKNKQLHLTTLIHHPH